MRSIIVAMVLAFSGSAIAQETTVAKTPAPYPSVPSGASQVPDVECADEDSVRATAHALDAREIVPLVNRPGAKFLLMVFDGGDGLVVAEVRSGCFNSATSMAAEQVQEILAHSRAA